MDNIPDLTAAKWLPFGDSTDWLTGARIVAVIPVRDDNGHWFCVPMAYACVDEYPEIVRDAEAVAVNRYRLKIARALTKGH